MAASVSGIMRARRVFVRSGARRMHRSSRSTSDHLRSLASLGRHPVASMNRTIGRACFMRGSASSRFNTVRRRAAGRSLGLLAGLRIFGGRGVVVEMPRPTAHRQTAAAARTEWRIVCGLFPRALSVAESRSSVSSGISSTRVVLSCVPHNASRSRRHSLGCSARYDSISSGTHDGLGPPAALPCSRSSFANRSKAVARSLPRMWRCFPRLTCHLRLCLSQRGWGCQPMPISRRGVGCGGPIPRASRHRPMPSPQGARAVRRQRGWSGLILDCRLAGVRGVVW